MIDNQREVNSISRPAVRENKPSLVVNRLVLVKRSNLSVTVASTNWHNVAVTNREKCHRYQPDSVAVVVKFRPVVATQAKANRLSLKIVGIMCIHSAVNSVSSICIHFVCFVDLILWGNFVWNYKVHMENYIKLCRN